MPPSENDRAVITGANDGIGYHILTILVSTDNRSAGLDANSGNLKARGDAEIYLRTGPLERLSSQVHYELKEVRRHVREKGENLTRLVKDREFERGVTGA